MILYSKHHKEKHLYVENKKIIINGKLGKIDYLIPLDIKVLAETKMFVPKKKINFFINLMKFMIYSVEKGWYFQLFVKGKGFKLIQYKEYLSFDLGYSNLFLYKNINSEIKIHKSKYKLIIFSPNKDFLKKIFYTLKNFFYYDKYHGKGLFSINDKKIIYKKLM